MLYETTAENLTSWDRPLAWCEHVTVGPPFLAARDTRFYASLLNGFRTGDSATQFLWPQGCSESPCDLSFFGSAHDSELVNSFTVNTNDKLGYFVACNARVGLLFGYAFASSEFPWLNIWESNNQKRRTRGMEFSNTPVEGTLKALIATPRLLGAPTFEWLDARKQLLKRFASFSAAISSDYAGIAKLEAEGGLLRIVGLSGEIINVDTEPQIYDNRSSLLWRKRCS